jgi:multicomponent Na+:H+ antiporter subunit E
MMPQTLLLSVPMALLWMIFSHQLSLEGFLVGYVFGFAIMLIVRSNTSFEEDDPPVRIAKIPSQLIALVVYIVTLAKDIFFSGIDVAGRVLDPKLRIKPGIHRISTQDNTNNHLISALSAHSITITPGELVIDFEEDENGQTILIVHALDKEASDTSKLERDQARRLQLIRRILGMDTKE